jgi:hypothetical protein
MKLFKHDTFVSTYAQYGVFSGISQGVEIAVNDCEPHWINDMYVRGEITFLQCRRLLKECGKEIIGEIANYFKVSNYCTNIEILTNYYIRAKEEREKAFETFITYCNMNNAEAFIELMNNYHTHYDAYVGKNEINTLLEKISDEGVVNYINENLKN